MGKGQVHHSHDVTSNHKCGKFTKYTSRGKEVFHRHILVMKQTGKETRHYALAVWITQKLLQLIKTYRHFRIFFFCCEATTDDVRQLQCTATFNKVPASKQDIKKKRTNSSLKGITSFHVYVLLWLLRVAMLRVAHARNDVNCR